MAKYTEQEKLEAVLRCIDESMSYRHSAHILGCDPKLVEQWVKIYQLHGTEGLSESHKSNEFVDKIVRFVYNIIEKRYFFFRTIIVDSSRKGMMICLLLQLN